MTAPTATETPRQEYDHWRGEQSKWELDESTARAALAKLDQDAAGSVLADPSKVETISKRRAELESRAGIAAQAAAEAGRRAGGAAVAVVREEAVSLDGDIAAAESEAADFDGETARLRDLLSAHSGQEWRAWTVDDEAMRRRDAGESAFFTFKNGHGPALHARAAALVRRRAILLGAADGADLHAQFPGIAFEELPQSLHPVTGVLPQVGFRDPARARDAQRAEAELLQSKAEAALRSCDDRIASGEARVLELQGAGQSRRAYDVGIEVDGLRRERAKSAKDVTNLRISVERWSA